MSNAVAQHLWSLLFADSTAGPVNPAKPGDDFVLVHVPVAGKGSLTQVMLTLKQESESSGSTNIYSLGIKSSTDSDTKFIKHAIMRRLADLLPDPSPACVLTEEDHKLLCMTDKRIHSLGSGVGNLEEAAGSGIGGVQILDFSTLR